MGPNQVQIKSKSSPNQFGVHQKWLISTLKYLINEYTRLTILGFDQNPVIFGELQIDLDLIWTHPKQFELVQNNLDQINK